MPLVEVYLKEGEKPTFQVTEFVEFLQKLFGVEPGVVQVMVVPVKDLAPEPVYISMRAKGTPPRREKIGQLLAEVEKWLSAHGTGRGKIRIELFEPSHQSVHAWKPSKL
eukprot:TRINITY_DN78197_c0_g1_i1.p1 TRINITY_DN78197_c0_g1~~TRINITY_DN78197_c0_g1_i1.p1  ORF type:complete len:109 (-),score=28.61 TRINITY_DN78197_c0_g1_i1:54-380(-)